MSHPFATDAQLAEFRLRIVEAILARMPAFDATEAVRAATAVEAHCLASESRSPQGGTGGTGSASSPACADPARPAAPAPICDALARALRALPSR